MKIAIDSRLIGQSGIGTFIENILLYATKTPDVQFLLIGNKQVLAPYSKLANCQIVECTYASFTTKELFHFPTQEVNQCDAFFTPNFNIPLGIKVPIFSTIHDVVFFDVKGICSPVGKLIRWMYMKRALHISKMVFTVSQFSEQRIRSIFHHRGDMTVVNNGISQELTAYRQKEGNSRQEKGEYVVFLGNLKTYKGVRDLIKAYHIAQNTYDVKYKLYIVGRIDARTIDKKLLTMIHQHDDKIQFITDADNRRVFDLLSGAKALVSPSHYEGFGIPPLEAMYLGTPAIISDIPTHQEVYRETPAIFFETGSVDDLARKLSDIPTDKCNVDEIVSKKYNFQLSALKIIHTIQEKIH